MISYPIHYRGVSNRNVSISVDAEAVVAVELTFQDARILIREKGHSVRSPHCVDQRVDVIIAILTIGQPKCVVARTERVSFAPVR